MKKNVIYLMALVFAISCVKEIPQEITPEPEQETIGSIVFSAEVENDDVKTTLGADEVGKLPLWNSGDEIAIFMGDRTGYKFRTEDDGTRRADFQGPVVSGGSAVEPVGGNDFDANVSVYPYSLAEEITSKGNGQFGVSITLPQHQTYTETSFASGEYPMVAVTETKQGSSLKFKNLCGLLKIQLLGDNLPIKSISIRGNNGEKLCGTAVVNAAYGSLPSLTFSKDAQEEVFLDCGNNDVRLNLTEATVFYIVLPPVEFTNGITVRIYPRSNTVIEKTTAATISIKRSTIKAIKAFTAVDIPPDYIENDVNLGKGISVIGNWDEDASTPISILYWAPVNCGYQATGTVNSDSDHRFGKIYEWGAGDATLPYVSGSSRITALQMYYYSTGSRSSIYYNTDISGTVYDMWNNNQGPCPDGWRLPTPKEFKALSGSSTGNYGWVSAGSYADQLDIYPGVEFFGANEKIAGKGVFLPAAGYRSTPWGYDHDRREKGYYWSSEVEKDGAFAQQFSGCLTFSSTTFDSQKNFMRAEACSVRCVTGDGDPQGEVHNPAVLTVTLNEIAETSAVCGGIVTSEGDAAVTERGICYSTGPMPTIVSTKVTDAGSGAGSFTCNLTGLTSSKKYYVRAYAKNEYGVYYSDVKSFIAPITLIIPDYIENGVNLGKSIAVLGDWDEDASTPISILYWAPVNCGYEESGTVNSNSDHRLGKLYQWGAGDTSLPYVYEGSSVVAREMYYDTATPSPWYNYEVIDGTTSDKWNNNQGPCPEGWRLPTSIEFKALCAGKNGSYGWVSAGTYAGQPNTYAGAEFFGANVDKTAGTGVFFPAAGYRYYNDGTAYYRGSYGYYWSSTPIPSDSYYAYFLYFYSSKLSPQYGSYRSTARSVRCVTE